MKLIFLILFIGCTKPTPQKENCYLDINGYWRSGGETIDCDIDVERGGTCVFDSPSIEARYFGRVKGKLIMSNVKNQWGYVLDVAAEIKEAGKAYIKGKHCETLVLGTYNTEFRRE